MRLISILVGALATFAATAGCFGGDDDAGGDDTTTPTATTPTTGTPTTTTPTATTPTADMDNGTGDDGGATAPPPMQAGSGSADFSANPTGVPAPAPVTIPEGYTQGNLTVTWSATAPVGANEAITVTFTDSAGNTLVCDLPQNAISPATPAPAPCVKEGPVAPGDGEVTFTGAGTIKADWVITVS